MSRKILLIGGGGHCRSCIDVIEAENRFEIAGVVDKCFGHAQTVLGYPVLGTDDDLPSLRRDHGHALVAVGQIESPATRGGIVRLLKSLGFEMPSIVSPRAHVSRHSSIGEGTIVMHGAMVNAGARVGAHCILNSRSLVEHDAEIGDYVHLSTGAIINGGCVVGSNSFVGSGAVVVHGIVLPERSFVRAGQLVASGKDYRVREID